MRVINGTPFFFIATSLHIPLDRHAPVPPTPPERASYDAVPACRAGPLAAVVDRLSCAPAHCRPAGPPLVQRGSSGGGRRAGTGAASAERAATQPAIDIATWLLVPLRLRSGDPSLFDTFWEGCSARTGALVAGRLLAGPFTTLHSCLLSLCATWALLPHLPTLAAATAVRRETPHLRELGAASHRSPRWPPSCRSVRQRSSRMRRVLAFGSCWSTANS